MSFLAKPMGYLLLALYKMIGSYGISILLFTIVVKLILLPLTMKQLKSTREMSQIQPKLKQLQEKYKNDKEKLNIKTMELYKEHKINPMGGCLPLVIQIPIIFGLFTLLRQPTTYITDPIFLKAVHESFLWIPNLSLPDPSLIAGLPMNISLSIGAILAAITTYFSMSSANTGAAAQNQTMKTMNMFFPFMIFYWAGSFPAGLTLYWVVSNTFQMIQQYFMPKAAPVKEELK